MGPGAGLGLRGDLRLLGATEEEAGATAEVLAVLISQRRTDMQRLEQIEAASAMMQSNANAMEGTRRRLQAAVAARDRDLGHLENQVGGASRRWFSSQRCASACQTLTALLLASHWHSSPQDQLSVTHSTSTMPLVYRTPRTFRNGDLSSHLQYVTQLR